MSAHDDDKFDETLPTTIDLGVPTGVRAQLPQFDPHARLKDHRIATPVGVRPVAAEVISALPPVRHEDPVVPRQRAASSFDPAGRIDDSSRTAKWAPREGGTAGRSAESSSTEVPTLLEGFGRPDAGQRRADDPARRAKALTQRGHDGAAGPAPRSANPRALPLAAPHPSVLQPAAKAPVPPRDRSEPMRVISMKTPADLEHEEKGQRVLPVVKLRAISELRQTPPRGMGNLAPPRDPREARSRRLRDNVIWGSLVVILASIVTLAIWFLARR